MLRKEGISFDFFDLQVKKKRILVYFFLKHKVIHLHTSSVYLRFLLSLACFFFFKKLIVTFHGNLGRYGGVKDILDKLTLYLAALPIVLNHASYDIAYAINKKVKMISAFIPPQKVESLDFATIDKISNLKQQRRLFCTNAFNVSFDRDGNETYRISDLVRVFGKYQDMALIISDPSGNYKLYLKSLNIEIPQNVLFLAFPHDFNAVIHEADCFIRFTSTDGDSLSVKEALSTGKQVIASNVVDRPKGVILVSDLNDLENKLTSFHINHSSPIFEDTGSRDLLNLYKQLNTL
ncbi:MULTISPECIES: hypothetical protein [Olivibacter]|uniref:Uncharacterized protein n=1 Tax=Olivibacter oleidegradans TaxID=760123 RepID=A0ABV6HGT1_9SPHI|nr:hypothetical protein [Olivibacter jilunii]